MYDVIIVGGGPAGLSAALILGRCRREVLVLDNGHNRNLPAQKLHCFLSQRDISPQEFHEKSVAQLEEFDSVHLRKAEVVSAKKVKNHFEVQLGTQEVFSSRKLLLATGVVDLLPKIEGLKPLFGKSVFHCAYCDGWEFRDQPLAIIGEGFRGYNSSMFLKTWSSDLILCTDGDTSLTAKQKTHLQRHGIYVTENKIARLEADQDQLKYIHFEDGSKLARNAIFFNTPSFIRSTLLDQLGCPYTEENGVETGRYETTKIPGLFAAGNILRDVQLVIVAAADGAQAAFGIHAELTKEDNLDPRPNSLNFI